jgi:hypothetical protein
VSLHENLFDFKLVEVLQVLERGETLREVDFEVEEVLAGGFGDSLVGVIAFGGFVAGSGDDDDEGSVVELGRMLVEN